MVAHHFSDSKHTNIGVALAHTLTYTFAIMAFLVIHNSVYHTTSITDVNDGLDNRS